MSKAVKKVAIVGAEEDSLALIKALDGLADFQIAGIVDDAAQAPGKILAKQMGLVTADRARDLSDCAEVDIWILTRATKSEAMLEGRSDQSEVLQGSAACLMLTLAQEQHRMGQVERLSKLGFRYAELMEGYVAQLDESLDEITFLNSLNPQTASSDTLDVESMYVKVAKQLLEQLKAEAVTFVFSKKIFPHYLLFSERKIPKEWEEQIRANFTRQAGQSNAAAQEARRLPIIRKDVSSNGAPGSDIGGEGGQLRVEQLSTRSATWDSVILARVDGGALTPQQQSFTRLVLNQLALYVENRQSSESLKLERDKLEGIVKNIDTVLIVTDEAGNVLLANEVAADTFGLDKEGLVGRSIDELSLPAPIQAVWNKVRDDESSGSMMREVEFVKPVDNSRVTGLVQVRFMNEADEASFRKKILLIHDVTELVQTRSKYVESERRHIQVANSLPGVIYQFVQHGDGRRGFPYMSDPVKAIFGVEAKAAMADAQIIFDCVHADDRPELDRTITESFQNLTGWKMDFRILPKDGTPLKWIAGNSTPQRVDANTVLWNGVLLDITNRKRAEEHMRIQHSAIEASPVGIVITDNSQPNKPIIYSNPAFSRLSGYSAEEMLSQNCRILQGKDRDQPPIAEMRQAIAEERGCKVTLRNYRKDGTLFWNQVTLSPVRDQTGTAGHFVGIQQDVSEAKQRERFEEKRRGVLERMAEGQSLSRVLESAVDLIESEISGAIGAIHLLDESGKHLEHGISPRLPDFYNQAIAGLEIGPTVGSCGAAAYLGERVIAEDLQTHPNWAAFRELTQKAGLGACWSSPLLAIDGSVVGSFAVYFLKPQKPDERSLHFIDTAVSLCSIAIEHARSTEKLELSMSALQATKDGIFIFDPETLRFTYVNEGAVHQTRYSREELFQMTPLDIKPRINEQEFREMIAPLLSGKEETVFIETVHRRKDAEELAVEIVLQYITLLNGHTQFVAVVRDVSERKQFEDRLNEGQKMEAIGKLAGGVAHDFNNQLFVIGGHCHSLLKNLEPGPFHKAAVEIDKAVKRSSDLTKQLLAFSRKQPIEQKVLDLNAIIASAGDMIKRLLAQNVIEYHFKAAPGLWPVKADQSQIEQIIANLAVNARDAMPEGGTLTIETQNCEAASPHFTNSSGAKAVATRNVLITVADNGKGMPAEVKKHIFEPFFTTKEKGKGTGLGLAMIYGIVNQMGGNIVVETALGEGTAFKIYLPICEGDSESLAAPAEVQAVAAPRGTETILVTEDEEAVRDIVVSNLREQGYTVLEAGDGYEALRVAADPGKQPIHLLLTDVIMPKMGGIRLAAEFQREYPQVPVFYMSGFTDDAAFQTRIDNGEIDLLLKPFAPDALLFKVREILDSSKGARTQVTAKKRILIIDDEEAIVSMLASQFTDAGYEVLTACDGKKGLEEIEKARPDLVLLDLNMPKLKGAGVLGAIRGEDGKTKMPVIVISGQDDVEAIYEGIAEDFFPKPMDMDVLLERVEAILKRHESPAPEVTLDKPTAPESPDTRQSQPSHPEAPVEDEGEAGKKVMIVDHDDKFYIQLATLFVNAGCRVNRAVTGREGLEKVISWQPDILLVRLNLPDLTGDNIVLAIRQSSAPKSIETLLYTNPGCKKLKKLCLLTSLEGTYQQRGLADIIETETPEILLAKAKMI